MSQALAEIPYDLRDIIENIVTEDDEPVDNLFSEKQQTLLKRSLYSSWTPPPGEDKPKKRRKFLAAANVGIFFALHEQPLVPDFFLSLDVEPHQDWYDKEHRTYFVWEFGKVPELVLEIVSNRKGKELAGKFKDYARMGVNYYVVYDPQKRLSKDVLCVYELGFGKRYRPRKDHQLPDLGLGLTLWQGMFEDHEDTWLRWLDAKGRLIPTGEERAAKAEERLGQAEKRAASAEAEVEKLRAELARRTSKPARKRSK
ncbi:MAG: Uma2 family endonuclease [Blastocatellia bacterium]